MTRVRRSKSRAAGALTGTRAVATGAVLYTALRAAFVGGRVLGARRAFTQAANGESGEPVGRPHPRPHQDEATGEVASSNTTRPRPSRTPAREHRPHPSLTLPSQRWPRMGAERR
jgi:hypothetical protein